MLDRIRQAPVALPLLGTIAAWGLASLVEGNASIFLAALTAFAIGIVVARLLSRGGSETIVLFALAYLLRSAAALVAYYWGKGEAYWVGGGGSDAIAYYETSFLDLGEALFQFSYAGFVTYNSFVTRTAVAFDQAHYLCNLQGPVVAGSLLVVLVFVVVRELRDARTGFAVALILAVHPALVSISAILLRDSLVGLFGWATMYLLIRLFQARSLPVIATHVALALAAIYVLSIFRLQSMLVFAGLSLVAIYFSTRGSATRRGLPPAVRRPAVIAAAVAGVVLAGSLLAGRLPPGLDASYFQSVVEYRLENAAQGSLGAALSSANPGIATLMYSLLALLAPFPFYGWSPEALGHPTAPLDYLVGMGGLVNQLLLLFALVGLTQAVRTRETLTLAITACIVGFVALTTLGGGDTVRYIAVHVFPLYLMIAIDGMRRARVQPRIVLVWLGVLLALYTMYETLKSALGSSYVLLAALVFLLYLVAALLWAWAITGPADRGPPGVPARPRGPRPPLAQI